MPPRFYHRVRNSRKSNMPSQADSLQPGLSGHFCSIFYDNKIRNHAIFPGNLTCYPILRNLPYFFPETAWT